jgi:hypothetical protein
LRRVERILAASRGRSTGLKADEYNAHLRLGL